MDGMNHFGRTSHVHQPHRRKSPFIRGVLARASASIFTWSGTYRPAEAGRQDIRLDLLSRLGIHRWASDPVYAPCPCPRSQGNRPCDPDGRFPPSPQPRLGNVRQNQVSSSPVLSPIANTAPRTIVVNTSAVGCYLPSPAIYPRAMLTSEGFVTCHRGMANSWI